MYLNVTRARRVLSLARRHSVYVSETSAPSVHAREPGEAEVGGASERLAVEQLGELLKEQRSVAYD